MHGCIVTQPYHNGLAKIAWAMRRVSVDSHRPLAGRLIESTNWLGSILSRLSDGAYNGGYSPANNRNYEPASSRAGSTHGRPARLLVAVLCAPPNTECHAVSVVPSPSGLSS